MKFSFVVIANNQINSVCNTIDSIFQQDYEDLEVIYVDDGSTDGTVEHVKLKYTEESRFQVIRHDESKGCVISRLDGIDCATGDWVLLADGDDSYHPETCSILANVISSLNRPVNMIGFGTEIVYVGNTDYLDKNDIADKFCEPHLGYMTREKIMEALYLKRTKAWNVWNKCYSISLAKYMASQAARERLISSEDFYLNFIACSAVSNYFGIPDRLYNYTIGTGISTARRLSLPAFGRHITSARCGKLTEEYAKKMGLYEKYKPTFEQHERDMLYSSYIKLTLLPEEDKPAASKMIFDNFGSRSTLSRLSYDFGSQVLEVAKHFDVQGIFPFQKRPIKTVGMLYHRMYNGGVERVIQLLTPILQNAGYKVVVITNDPINELDYPLPEETVRVSIGNAKYDVDPEKGYGARFDALTSCIEENQIDAVIYHAWVSDDLFWDMCTIKNAGAACIVHSHGAFFMGLNIGWWNCMKSASIFQHADAMTVLSEVDRYYWSAVTPNVFRVNNPLTFLPESLPVSKQDNHNIVWAGRFDPTQKNPYDILYIFNEVAQTVSDAKLYLLGTGEEQVVSQMYALVDQFNLQDKVVFVGYTNDVSSYLQQSAVYLFTSDFEGYSMAFAEALSHGLPIVTYPLPYMTMAKDSKASVQVGWKDIHGAANAVIELLTNDKKRLEMSKLAREEAVSFGKEDFSICWNRILGSLESENGAPELVLEKKVLDAYQKTVNLAFEQMAHRIHWQSSIPTQAQIDYTSMSKIKRWIAYLLYDHATLKAIVKHKCRNHPKVLNFLVKVWKRLRQIKGTSR